MFRYLRGTEDLGLHYTKTGPSNLVGYADAGFKSDENTGKSQTGYIFLRNNAPISWKSVKQTVTATSTNHAELIAFHEATREVVWLRTIDKIISDQCELSHSTRPTTIFEDNATCVAQVTGGFIKANRMKYISPQIFGFTQDLIESGEIEVKKVQSSNNIADILTKALPAYTHRRLVQEAGMRSLQDLVTH